MARTTWSPKLAMNRTRRNVAAARAALTRAGEPWYDVDEYLVDLCERYVRDMDQLIGELDEFESDGGLQKHIEDFG